MVARTFNPVPATTAGADHWHLVDAGIDYLSFTSRMDEAPVALKQLGQRIADDHRGKGADMRPWRWQGYVGEVGDGVAYGWRLDGTIIVLQGRWAHEYAPMLGDVQGRARRVDVQATLSCDIAEDVLAARYYAGHPERRDRMGRALHHRLITNTDGGQTLYVGAPTSQRILRLYRKDALDPVNYPRWSWRWEIQLRGIAASATWLAQQQNLEHRQRVPAFVGAWYHGFGLPVPWSYAPIMAVPNIPRREWDHERAMRWLRDSVAPCVERLLMHYTLDQLKDALGIDAIDQTTA